MMEWIDRAEKQSFISAYLFTCIPCRLLRSSRAARSRVSGFVL
jgi:hypothetical protein